MTTAYTIEEIIDVIQGDLTISGALPKLLPDLEIRRLIENKVAPWFYQNYLYGVQKTYYHVPHEAFYTEEWTNYRYLQLPCEIQTISWIYEVRKSSLLSLGINAPNLSINLGVTNQPYLSSYTTTIGELGVYKTVLDSFSDMLNQLSKFTVKHTYNQMNNRLNILTSVKGDLILECYANVQKEGLYSDPNFIAYATAASKKQLGALMTRYNFTLPGGIQYNGDSLISEGNEEISKIEEEIKHLGNSSFIFMVKR